VSLNGCHGVGRGAFDVGRQLANGLPLRFGNELLIDILRRAGPAVAQQALNVLHIYKKGASMLRTCGQRGDAIAGTDAGVPGGSNVRRWRRQSLPAGLGGCG
jgi:hypothetical protein